MHTTGCRYDHYATLCELLPVGLPSLRCCLAVLANKGKVTKQIQHFFMFLAEVFYSGAGFELSECFGSGFYTSEKANYKR
jgi:hypothetical protein